MRSNAVYLYCIITFFSNYYLMVKSGQFNPEDGLFNLKINLSHRVTPAMLHFY